MNAPLVCCTISYQTPSIRLMTTISMPVQCAMLLFFLFFHASFSHLQPSVQNGNNATDEDALRSFRSVIQDTYGSLSLWNDSLHFCRWRGIQCSNSGKYVGRVIALQLDSLNLTGTLSPYLANLTFLKGISLSNNQFQESIPSELGRLFRLQHLNLSMNFLEGSIPTALTSSCSNLINVSLSDNKLQGPLPRNVSHCTSLQLIELKNNNLEGEIPAEFGYLENLKHLNLGANRLGGRIPSSLSNLSHLISLDLSNNGLQGSIPESFGVLLTLSSLDLSFNRLTGVLPDSLWNLSSIRTLSVGYNLQLSGALPVLIGHLLPNLQSLSMSCNRFYGPVPASLSNASGIEVIALDSNDFSGKIPPSLGTLQNMYYLKLVDNHLEAREASDWHFLEALTNITKLKKLELNCNKLGGTVPNYIGNFSTELIALTIGYNELFGRIPVEIGNLVGLNAIIMGPNFLTGSIPSSLGMLRNLHILALDFNNLSGEIPDSLGNLTQLFRVFLESNELSGSIPSTVGNWQHLEYVTLANNKLTGSIPKDLLSITSITIGINLTHNSLTGPIPSEIQSLENLAFFDVSENKLSGELPAALGKCKSLENLNLAGNLFHGAIPVTLESLKGILQIDLSRNNLSGFIPRFLEEFKVLYYLNLSFNQLEGEVPRNGVFAKVSGISVVGNTKLCGGNNTVLHLPPCLPQASGEKHGLHVRIIVPTVIVLSCLIFLSSLFAARYCITSPCRKIPVNLNMKEQHLKVSYAELAKATEGFSEAKLMGSGSFGSVYKGRLHDQEIRDVAVKVLNLSQKGAYKSFTAECEALRSIRHRNLVRVLTACSSVDFRGNEFKALVYEFMSNGSLEQWLHPKDTEQRQPKDLNLLQRLNIAIDIASALEYLHHQGPDSIVHCDLKPSNVLLDDDMTAHVGDFGISRFVMRGASKSFGTSTSSIALKGSIGYVAPEYGMANKVSTQGDVYSYGILLLEMFTGRRPIGNNFGDGLSLRSFVDTALPDRVKDITDTSLVAEAAQNNARNLDSRGRTFECIISIFGVGLQCSKESPMERMQIGDVVRELQAIRDVLLVIRASWQGEEPNNNEQEA